MILRIRALLAAAGVLLSTSLNAAPMVEGHGGGAGHVAAGYGGFRGYGYHGYGYRGYGYGGYGWRGYGWGWGVGVGLGWGYPYYADYPYYPYSYYPYGYPAYPAYPPPIGAAVPAGGVAPLGAPTADVVLTVMVPTDAIIWVNGARTTQTGPRRDFISSGLAPGKTYTFEVRTEWKGQDGKAVSLVQHIPMRAGEKRAISISVPAGDVSPVSAH